MGLRLCGAEKGGLLLLAEIERHNSQNSLQFATIEWLRGLVAARRDAKHRFEHRGRRVVASKLTGVDRGLQGRR